MLNEVKDLLCIFDPDRKKSRFFVAALLRMTFRKGSRATDSRTRAAEVPTPIFIGDHEEREVERFKRINLHVFRGEDLSLVSRASPFEHEKPRLGQRA